MCRRTLLQAEFPLIPAKHIKDILDQERTLFKAYGKLTTQDREYESKPASSRAYTRIKNPRTKPPLLYDRAYADNTEIITGPVRTFIQEELEAARKMVRREAENRRRIEMEALREQDNFLEAQQSGQTAEW